MADFVPDEFHPPVGVTTPQFRLEPLGPQHNEADYAAWTSSMHHIRDTPGFAKGNWPREMTIDQNRDDLLRHQRDFQGRTGFTYTVLGDEDDVIGCVYIYPLEPDPDIAARYLDAVPVSYLVLDELGLPGISERYAAPVVVRHPTDWRLVYNTPGTGVRVYERVH